jgi:hypothetical protein
VRTTAKSRTPVESVTPRIDSERSCRCRAPIIWDEVFGWLHALPDRVCPVPQPADR